MAAKAHPAPMLSAEPDAGEREKRDEDGEHEAAKRDREQIHGRRCGDGAEAVERHGQHEELQEEERDTARPEPLMHRLLHIDRGQSSKLQMRRRGQFGHAPPLPPSRIQAYTRLCGASLVAAKAVAMGASFPPPVP